MDTKLSGADSPKGYWPGIVDIQKLAVVAKGRGHEWDDKAGSLTIYAPAPQHIPCPRFNVSVPKQVHHAGLFISTS